MRSPASPLVTCLDATGWLPALVDVPRDAPTSDPGEVHPEVLAHVRTCLRCQAEVARYRRLLRLLHQLRGDVVEPRPASVAAVLEALREESGHRDLRSLLLSRRAAYVGGAVVATAAASAAGVIVWASRRRVDLAG